MFTCYRLSSLKSKGQGVTFTLLRDLTHDYYFSVSLFYNTVTLLYAATRIKGQRVTSTLLRDLALL